MFRGGFGVFSEHNNVDIIQNSGHSHLPPRLYSNIETSSTDTNAAYHSLQVQVIRKLARGFSVQGAYTFSKALDHYSSDVVGGRLFNPFNRDGNWGPADFDSKHNGNLTFVVELRNAGTSAFHKAILHDWQVSGIFAARSGTRSPSSPAVISPSAAPPTRRPT